MAAFPKYPLTGLVHLFVRLFLFQYHHNLLYLSLFTFVCLISRQYNYAFHELRMQLENQVVQIQIQS